MALRKSLLAKGMPISGYGKRAISQQSSPFRLGKIKLITFDVTGTLLKFRKPPFQIYAEFGAKHGLVCDTELIKDSFKAEFKRLNEEQPHFGKSWHEWWTQLVMRTFKGAQVEGSEDEMRMRKFASELIEHFKTDNCWALKDGALDLIKGLNASVEGGKLSGIGIISNTDSRLYILLKVFKLENIFKPIILSNECQVSKPSPKIFNLALKELPVKPKEALHVGDNYELDYIAAINAGWRGCLIGEEQNLAQHKRSIKEGTCGGEEDLIFPNLRAFHHFLSEQGKPKTFPNSRVNC